MNAVSCSWVFLLRPTRGTRVRKSIISVLVVSFKNLFSSELKSAQKNRYIGGMYSWKHSLLESTCTLPLEIVVTHEKVIVVRLVSFCPLLFGVSFFFCKIVQKFKSVDIIS